MLLFPKQHTNKLIHSTDVRSCNSPFIPLTAGQHHRVMIMMLYSGTSAFRNSSSQPVTDLREAKSSCTKYHDKDGDDTYLFKPKAQKSTTIHTSSRRSIHLGDITHTSYFVNTSTVLWDVSYLGDKDIITIMDLGRKDRRKATKSLTGTRVGFSLCHLFPFYARRIKSSSAAGL